MKNKPHHPIHALSALFALLALPALVPAAACAVACLLTASLSAQSLPDAKPAADDIVHLDTLNVSSGEWGALQNATEARRQSSLLIDTINPDDIGVLPDFNIGDNLQRLPGIAIELDEAEARFVTIRGFNAHYNTTTINGSTFAVPDRNGRRVYMDVLPASLASSIEVTKTWTPDKEGHSVGGSIDIKGPVALRKKPLTVKLNSRIGWYGNDDGYDGNGPSGNADLLVTRRLGPNMGIAVSANYFKRDSYTPYVSYNTAVYTVDENNPAKLRIWTDADSAAKKPAIPTDRTWFWRRNNRERVGGSFKWEWRPARGLDLWALAYHNTATDNESREHDALDNYTNSAVRASTSDPNTVALTGLRFRQNFGKFDFERSLYGIQLGGDLRLGPENTLSFRATRSGSRFRNPEDWAEWRRGNTTLPFNITQEGGYFYFTGTGAGTDPAFKDNLEQDHAKLDSYTFYRRQFDDRSLDETVHDFQADYERKNFLGSKALTLKAGAKYRRISRDFDEERDRYLTRGSNSYRLNTAAVANTALHLSPPGAYPYQSMLILDPTRVRVGWEIEYTANKAAWDAVFDPMTADDNNLDYTTVENVTAAYGMLTYAAHGLTITGGVRVEHTADESTGRVLTPSGTTTVWQPTRNDGSYTNALPGLVVAYDLGRADKFRLGASMTIGRPPFNQFAPVGETVSSSVDAEGDDHLTITRSNPGLKPRRSTNVSLAYDHYFKKNKGLVSVVLHHNTLRDEIFTMTRDMPILWEGQMELATVRQPTNSTRPVDIEALELILLRHLDFLPGLLSGLKINANLTFISSDFRILMDARDAQGNEIWHRARTAIGQPKRAANLSILYDWKRLSAKIAIAHTSLKLTDSISTTYALRNQYNDTGTRLNANITYKFNKHWRVDLSGWNLTGAKSINYIGLDQSLARSYSEPGHALFAGFTYSY